MGTWVTFFLSLLQCFYFSSIWSKAAHCEHWAFGIRELFTGSNWTQWLFNHQSASFTISPDMLESLCNCNMNSYAREFKIEFLDTEELVQKTYVQPDTNHRSQPSTKQAQRRAEAEPCEGSVFMVSLHCTQSAYQMPTRDSFSFLTMLSHRPEHESLQVNHTPPVFSTDWTGLYWHYFFRAMKAQLIYKVFSHS